MEYRSLGKSGLKVSVIGLGGDNFGPYANEPTSVAVINHAIDMGVNFIDTADVYGDGHSEEFIGKAIKGKRSQVVIATKFGRSIGEGPNESGGSRHHIMKAINASLRRLQTDYIDLYQMHFPDSTTPIEETLRALDDMVRSGKVRYIGCSNFPAWQLCQALWTSKVNHLHSFVTIQSEYNLLARQIERQLVPCCQAYGIGVIPYLPLFGGFLTGKYRKGEEPPTDTRMSGPYARLMPPVFTQTNWKKLAKLEAFATECGHTVGELALAWLAAKPWVSTVIPGARKIEQVSANVAAGEWKLTADEVAKVDTIS